MYGCGAGGAIYGVGLAFPQSEVDIVAIMVEDKGVERKMSRRVIGYKQSARVGIFGRIGNYRIGTTVFTS
jgi:hypothetical protein